MKKTARVAILLGVCSAAVVGGSLAGLAIASAIPPTEPRVEEGPGSVHPVAEFPVNESGQTYGYVDQGLLSDPSARAQLVAVTTDEGVDGWAYFAELMPAAMATTPEEAEALSTGEPYKVAVYELDGRTLIGFQTVNRQLEQ